MKHFDVTFSGMERSHADNSVFFTVLVLAGSSMPAQHSGEVLL